MNTKLAFFTVLLAITMVLPAWAANNGPANQNKLAIKRLSTQAAATAKLSSPTFRLKDQLTLGWISTYWDTIQKNEFTYTQSTLVLQNLGSTYIPSTGIYIPNQRSNNVYDGQGRMTSSTTQFWDGSTWLNSARNIYTYDTQGSVTEESYSTWNGSTWAVQFGSKYAYTYNASNKALTMTEQTFDNGSWVNSYKEIYTLNAQNDATEIIFQEWDVNIWVNAQRGINLTWNNYSQFKYLTATVQEWNGSQWDNLMKIVATYNTNGDMLTDTYQDWDGSAWLNSFRYLYTYTGTLIASEIGQDWNGQWDNAYRYLYTYDTYGNDVSSTNYYFSAGNWLQDGGLRHTYTYDVNTNVKTDIQEAYDPFSMWEFTIQFINSYDNVTGVNNAIVKGISIFPNPATTQLIINGLDNSSIKIFSMAGQLVSTQAVTLGMPVDISQLTRGMYTLQITNAERVITQKFIKQ